MDEHIHRAPKRKESTVQHLNKDRLLINIQDIRRIARTTPAEIKPLYAVFFIMRIEYTKILQMFTAVFAFHLPIDPRINNHAMKPKVKVQWII